QSILESNPKVPTMWGNLGWTQYGMRKYAEALESSRKALAIDPKLAYVRFNIGLIFAVQNDWDHAQKEYADAIAIAQLSEIAAGIEDIKDALKKKPDCIALKQSQKVLEDAAKKAR